MVCQDFFHREKARGARGSDRCPVRVESFLRFRIEGPFFPSADPDPLAVILHIQIIFREESGGRAPVLSPVLPSLFKKNQQKEKYP